MSSRPEPEWDDVEVGWMEALEWWRTEQVCPLCGWPKSICQDPMTEFYAETLPPVRCQITTHLRRSQKAWAESNNQGHGDALLWSARMKAEGSPTPQG